MHLPVRLDTAPANLPDFIAEILPAFDALYGPAASAHYGRCALAGISASLASPAVSAYGSMYEGEAAALLFASREGTRTSIAFFHVLGPYRHLPAGDALLEFALRDLEEREGEILTDFVPFFPMAVDECFARRGFAKVSRQIMRRAPWNGEIPLPVGIILRPDAAGELEALATTLAETYAHHAERFLFVEVQSEQHALSYLQRIQEGGLGLHLPGYTIGAWKGKQCAGLALGCQVLPGLGFVLHLAVRPCFQGLGLGRALLGALGAAFAREGMDYIALGVTCDNPAVTLYHGAGFAVAAQVPVYYRA